MTPEKFDALLDMVVPKMRDAIPPRVMLEVTLYFTATGNSCRTLQYFFRVSKVSISNFIPEVCDATTSQSVCIHRRGKCLMLCFSVSSVLLDYK